MDDVQKPIEISETLMNKLGILTFSCEGKTVHVAKDVLLNACPNFTGLVSGSFQEKQENVIELTQTSYDAFNGLVQFINSGTFNVDDWTSSQWQSAISLAHEYHCELFLQKLVEVLKLLEYPFKDIFDILRLSEKLQIKELVEKSWAAIESLTDVIITDRSMFCELPEEDVLKLVARDTFYVDEHQLLTAVLAWLEVHPAADPKSLLANIRWEQTNADLLGKATSVRPLFATLNNKRRRILQPLIWTRTCLPNVNLASLFVKKDSKLIATGKDKDDHFNASYNTYYTLVTFPNMFRLNCVRFKLFGSESCDCSLWIKAGNSSKFSCSWTGRSWQEVYFNDEFVNHVVLKFNSEVWLNSFECMFSKEIPKLCDNNSFIASKNMVADPDFPFQVGFNTLRENCIDFPLRQPCHVGSVALYLKHFLKEWPLDILAENNVKLSIVKQDRAEIGSLIVVVLYFDLKRISTVCVSGRNIIENLLRVECPADLRKLHLSGKT